MSEVDFQCVFRSIPGLLLLLKPDPDFTIVDASDAYLQATFTDRKGIVGRGLFDVFPDDPGKAGATGTVNLGTSLQRVLATGAADTMAIQRYAVQRSAAEGGSFEERFWSPVNSPVLSAEGTIRYLIHRVEDVTDLVGLRDRVLTASDRERRIYEVALSNTPDLVYVFDLEHRFTYANEALLKMWGKTREEALGKNCLELGYEPWHAEMHDREIEQVVAARQPIRGEVPFNGTEGRRIYDYIFVPVLGPSGDVVAVAGTTRDVTERQQIEQAVREQAKRLSDADRAKDEFLATLAHELRNPLAPLRNGLHVLRLGGGQVEATAAVHAMMERQVHHLIRLVDDLLELSRISRGTFALRKERVQVATIVRNAVETSEPLIQAAGHRLSVSMPSEPLWLEGDPVRLAQVLANLLNNAAKYTEPGGDIAIRAERSANAATISIRDNGAGITPEAIPRMFEMFSRGESASTRGQGGLGIGLSLSRRLAEMHGGSIEAHSEGPGKGSEFKVHVPLARSEDAPSPASRDRACDVPIPRRRVLVVDDNDDAADSLGMLLEFLGADVRIARGGPEALAAFVEYDPALVLLDIGMPGMDGYEVARQLRRGHPERRVLIVALTGWGQDEDRRRAREAGFDHHLVKPAELEALQQLLA